MKQQSTLEKIGGNLGVSTGLTFIGALAGGPVAALLPLLSTSLAATRHAKRIDDAFRDLDSKLELVESSLRDLTDNQYKLIGETILALATSVNIEKIELLKSCILNTIEVTDINDSDITVISRALRDISIKQFRTLVQYRDSEEIVIYELVQTPKENDRRTWLVTGAEDAISIFTLSNLGLLAIVASGAGGTIHYKYLDSAYRLIDLCLGSAGA